MAGVSAFQRRSKSALEPANFSNRARESAELACRLLVQHGLADWNFCFNHRKIYMGVCRHSRKRIELSRHFVEVNSDELIRDVILHEIAHALVGPMHGHDDVWRQKCLEIGARPNRECADAAMPAGRWQ